MFGKDIFIRKSMLDDCKGSKFEDMLAALSISVLQKVLADDEADTSAARKLVLDGPDSHFYYKSMLPLTISYRAALKGRLREKKELKLRFCRFGRLLEMKQDELAQRTHSFDETAKLWRKKIIPRRTVDKLRKHVEVNWYGDKAWVDLLTKSDRYPMTNTLIERPFEHVWPHVTNDTVHRIRSDNKQSLLENLEQRVAAQNERLERWRKIQESLVEEKDSEDKNEVAPHTEPEQQLLATGSNKSGGMGRTLAHSDHAVRLQGGGGHSRTSSLQTTETLPVASDQRQRSGRSLREREPTSKSPLKRNHYRTLHTKSYSSSQINTPSSSMDNSLSFIKPETIDSRATDDADIDLVSSMQKMSVAESVCDELDIPSSEMQKVSLSVLDQPSTQVADVNNSYFHAEPPRSPQKMSLVERTRMSMAMMSPLKITPAVDRPPSASASPICETAEDDTQQFDLPASEFHRSETLQDRTRQSMSLMSARPQGRRPSYRPRSSVMYPTNQLESPRKNLSSYEEDSTSILEEILPDLDVDYETVFKSRPKIALSPRLKPMTDGVPNIEEALDEGASIEDFS